MATNTAITRATVSPSDLFEFLVTYMPTRRPIIVHSGPALGKSQIAKQAARKLCGEGCVIADVRAGQLDGAIVRGFPDMPPARGKEQRVAHFAPLSCWPQQGPGVIFLDELDKAEMETQNALLEMLLDRRLGDYCVPPDVFVLAAANRMTDRAGSNRLNNALKSRCIHLHLVPSLEDWLAWASTAEVHPLVIAYIELKGAAKLYEFDHADTEADSFPAPRTWEMLSDGLKLAHDDRLLYHLVAGSIGANATAADFAAFAKWYFHLPPKSEVLSKPDTFAIPQEGSLRWALAVALVEWTKGCTPKELDSIVTATLRLTPELTTFGMVHLIARNPAAFKLPKVMKWAANNQALLNRRRVKVAQ